jgi:peptidoglycan/LPS O-acetylase OafA/YrhL
MSQSVFALSHREDPIETEEREVLMVLSKTVLVVLAGVYAMRASNVLFHPQAFQPLMGVALFAFVMSVLLFHRPPTGPGWWMYTVIGLCLVGVAANTMLFVAPDALHNNPTDRTFSLVSIVGWAIVALGFVARTLFRDPSVA